MNLRAIALEQGASLLQLSQGLERGLQSQMVLEEHLVSWIYEQGQGTIGFANSAGPWQSWAQHVSSPLLQQLFQCLALNQSVEKFIGNQHLVDVRTWLELAVVLQRLRKGLVSWFDQQPYNAEVGRRFSGATFMTFAGLWCQLSNGLKQSHHQQLARAGFQLAMQVLRAYSRRDDFPLYSGVFISLTGDARQYALDYLNRPLQALENTQEKGRVLTLMGYSQRILGRFDRAAAHHEEALAIAQAAEDWRCEVANLSHLSRITIACKEYEKAIGYGQRALVRARLLGDRLGEANSLASLGYGMVSATSEQEQMEAEAYEQGIGFLQQGLELSESLEDRQSQALCCNSLGIAYVMLGQPQVAIEYLESGAKLALWIGDAYLRGTNFNYLAEANYKLGDAEQSIYYGCLGMYLLEQMRIPEWRRSAKLLLTVKERLGEAVFLASLGRLRSKIVPVIGIDGFDYVHQLLESFQ